MLLRGLWGFLAGLVLTVGVSMPPVWAAEPQSGTDPPATLGTPEPPPVVVELFTSESCGMCPPADAFLIDLDQEPGVIALSYHVTLWNFLGWRDPLSHSRNTRRQKVYNRRLRGRSPFTPQMVLDGMVSEPGARRDRIHDSITRLRDRRRGRFVPVDVALADGQEPMVTVRIGRMPAEANAADHQHNTDNDGRVLLVAFRSHRNVVVRGGTNDGRRTDYINVVYAIRDLSAWSGDPLTLSTQVPLDEGHTPEGLAVLVQAARQGPILGARTLALADDAGR